MEGDLLKQITIIFPPLVEEAYRFFKEVNSEISKQEVFKILIEQNVVKPNGYPTDFALETGVVSEFTEEANITFDELLAIYPVFRRYPSEHFKLINGFWMVDECLKARIEQDILN